ncbi:hypothetical protein BJ684DRAFT_15327 [Piptocephalis cylindrospora]|uniref:Uncharacterized protein n=1 Tax=Piptocephalis cylindrospora TaxID=1907219 RepID=A0A4P9Y5M0_9FUNG|nr:hypothetical protein BJ684DRAFT_15327 [Piptocephalis cylindrospora]|eukprot:RKP14328.1 hypothetical protein BJ684DRAFT_15327 [Piptocephalis cylindrospora]
MTSRAPSALTSPLASHPLCPLASSLIQPFFPVPLQDSHHVSDEGDGGKEGVQGGLKLRRKCCYQPSSQRSFHHPENLIGSCGDGHNNLANGVSTRSAHPDTGWMGEWKAERSSQTLGSMRQTSLTFPVGPPADPPLHSPAGQIICSAEAIDSDRMGTRRGDDGYARMLEGAPLRIPMDPSPFLLDIFVSHGLLDVVGVTGSSASLILCLSGNWFTGKMVTRKPRALQG